MKDAIKRLTHDEIKEKARKTLKERGYEKNEIYEEYPISISNGKRYIIDIAAVRNRVVEIAIECGELKAEKAMVLSQMVKKLIHIPYHYGVYQTDTEKEKRMESEIIDLKEIIKTLTKEKEEKRKARKEKPLYHKRMDKLIEKVEEISPLPGYCAIIDDLIKEISVKREENFEDTKNKILTQC